MQQQPNRQPAPILNCPLARAWFHENGMTQQLFAGTIFRADAEADTIDDELAPPGAAGVRFWSAVVEELRRVGAAIGWRVVDHMNMARLVSPDGTKQIVVQTGDPSGDPTMPVKQSVGRGPATKVGVLTNDARQSLMYGLADGLGLVDSELGAEFWILQVARDSSGLYCELSLPRRMDKDGRVVQWTHRLPYDMGPSLELGSGDDADDQDPLNIDVPQKE